MAKTLTRTLLFLALLAGAPRAGAESASACRAELRALLAGGPEGQTLEEFAAVCRALAGRLEHCRDDRDFLACAAELKQLVQKLDDLSAGVRTFQRRYNDPAQALTEAL